MRLPLVGSVLLILCCWPNLRAVCAKENVHTTIQGKFPVSVIPASPFGDSSAIHAQEAQMREKGDDVRFRVIAIASDAPIGNRDVIVTNPDGKRGKLLGGFSVRASNQNDPSTLPAPTIPIFCFLTFVICAYPNWLEHGTRYRLLACPPSSDGEQKGVDTSSSRWLRPCNGEQERALLKCLDIVLEAPPKCQQISWAKILFPVFRKVHAKLPLNYMNGYGALCAMVTHVTPLLHPNENDPKLRVFHDGFGTPPGFTLP